MLNRTQKAKIVEELTDKFKRQKVVLFSDLRGISVTKLQGLRRLLKKDGGEYKVAKKTLLDRALTDANLEVKTKQFEGEIGVAFGYGDEVAPAKTIFKFSRDNETFKILGGIFGKRFLTDKDIVALAKLPPREALIGQLLGVLSAPLRNLVTVLHGNTRNLVVVLNKIQSSRSK